MTVLERSRNARTGAQQSRVSLLLSARPPALPLPERTPPPMADEELLRRAVCRDFARIALFPRRAHDWKTGPAHAEALGYEAEAFAALPEAAREAFCGVGRPLASARLATGMTVVDVGCGAGADVLLAAAAVGETGEVIGVEAAEELLQKGRVALKQSRVEHARLERGAAEALPLADESADVVLANGVINALVADKLQALREALRVLRPGGRLVLADVVVEAAAPAAARASLAAWSSGLVGPVPASELVSLAEEAGFVRVGLELGGEPFSGTRQESAARAAGARSAVLVAVKEGLNR